MSKAYVAVAIKGVTGCTAAMANDAARAVFRAMKEVLKERGALQVQGFGRFRVVARDGRSGTNPRNGVKIAIPANKTVRFKPSKQLRREL